MGLSLLGDKGADQVVDRVRRRHFRRQVLHHLQQSGELNAAGIDMNSLAELLDSESFWRYIYEPSATPPSDLDKAFDSLYDGTTTVDSYNLSRSFEAAIVYAVLRTGTDSERLAALQRIRSEELMLHLVNLGHDTFASLATVQRDVKDLLDRVGGESGPSPRLFGVQPLAVNDFVGRTGEIEVIEAIESGFVALVGVGGVGKTQIAARLFEATQRSFDYAVWIDMKANCGQAIFDQIASALSIPVEDDPAQATIHYMEGSGSTWLIVLDNVVSPEQIRALVPRSPTVKTVITTRYQSWTEFGRQVQVDILDSDLARRFLAARAGRPDDPACSELAGRLGNLPLALALAGSYCAERAMSFERYISSVLPQDIVNALTPMTQQTYDRTIDAIWRESLRAVAEIEPECVQLVEVMSVLDWRNVSRSWLAERLEEEEPGDLDYCLALLAAYSLVQLAEDAAAISHGIIADGIAADADDEVAANVAELFHGSVGRSSPELSTVERHREPIRHLMALVDSYPNRVSAELLAPLIMAADQLNEQSSQLIDFHQNVATLCESILGERHSYSMIAQDHLARAYQIAGEFDRAVSTFEKTLELTIEILGPEHMDTLLTKNSLAMAYLDQGSVERALRTGESVVSGFVRLVGEDDPHTLMAKNNLACAYVENGMSLRALGLFETVLADREETLGPDHPHTTLTRGNLALCYQDAGRLDEALKLLEYVADEKARSLGSNHPEAVVARGNLAVGLVEAGRTDEGRRVREEVVSLQEEILGESHPDTLKSLGSLANILQLEGQVRKSIALARTAVDRCVAGLGEDHPVTLYNMWILAASLQSNGDLHEAIEIEQRVVAMRAQQLGDRHPDTLRALVGLACLHRDLSEFDEAIRLLSGLLPILEESLGGEHTETVWASLQLGVCYQKAGRSEDAARVLGRLVPAAEGRLRLGQDLGEYVRLWLEASQGGSTF